NAGSALGPLLAAFIVLPRGQGSVAWFAVAALLAIVVLARVSAWYKGQNRIAKTKTAPPEPRVHLSRAKIGSAIAILIALVFSKYFYLVSLTSYYTFYLIHKFGVSVRTAQLYLFLFLGAV